MLTNTVFIHLQDKEQEYDREYRVLQTYSLVLFILVLQIRRSFPNVFPQKHFLTPQ